jgi:Zn-dependent protease with chaperone function
MIGAVVLTVVSVWLSWVALLLISIHFTARFAAPTNTAYVAGVLRPKVVLPAAVAVKLTFEEQSAMMTHEEGHLVRRHLLHNFLRAVTLRRRTTAEAIRQELEADAWVVKCGRAAPLASALRKLSTHWFDLHRADLLEQEVRAQESRVSVRLAALGGRDARVEATIREG